MPVTKSAKKKMRRDEHKTVINVRQRRALKDVVKKARETKTAETIRQAIAAIDKAVKNNLFHKNKAARLKSQLTRGSKPAAASKTTKTAPKKATPKKAAPKKAATKKPAAKKPAAKKSAKK